MRFRDEAINATMIKMLGPGGTIGNSRNCGFFCAGVPHLFVIPELNLTCGLEALVVEHDRWTRRQVPDLALAAERARKRPPEPPRA